MANPLFVSLLRLKSLSMRLLLGEDRREAHSPEAQRKFSRAERRGRTLILSVCMPEKEIRFFDVSGIVLGGKFGSPCSSGVFCRVQTQGR